MCDERPVWPAHDGLVGDKVGVVVSGRFFSRFYLVRVCACEPKLLAIDEVWAGELYAPRKSHKSSCTRTRGIALTDSKF